MYLLHIKRGAAARNATAQLLVSGFWTVDSLPTAVGIDMNNRFTRTHAKGICRTAIKLRALQDNCRCQSDLLLNSHLRPRLHDLSTRPA